MYETLFEQIKTVPQEYLADIENYVESILYRNKKTENSLPPIFWLYLTVFMKLTEERWLLDRFGEEYKAYSKRVNRFIPWKKNK